MKMISTPTTAKQQIRQIHPIISISAIKKTADKINDFHNYNKEYTRNGNFGRVLILCT